MKLRPVSAAVLLLLSGMLALAHAGDARRPYIVQLADKPVASYTGGVAGLKATQPAPGAHLNLASADVQLYSDYLLQKQTAIKSIVANAPTLYDYQVVLNGFSAMLTDAEVRALQANSGVSSVLADEPRHMVTNYTPTFLGLDGPNGLWNQLGGKGHAGENVVIGVVDGGAWPENPSYADRLDANGVPTFDNSGTLAYTAPQNWNGVCETGDGFTVANCNNKLIGARYFNTGFLATGLGLHWTEFVSPRDSIGGTLGHGGHGTHTSTTAGGNNNVPAQVSGIPMAPVSGMAPRARLAIYKVCWSYNDNTDPTGGKNSCWGADSVAAIEQAVLDGVNVINYSISGGTTVDDPVEQAFLHAANAGVFVSAAAGNDGPANAVNHISPWLTTVAASTHNRFFKGDVTLGNNADYSGASLNINPLPAGTPIIRAEDAGLAGANATALSLCYSAGSNGGVAVLDPAKVAGKIVTCTRGVSARVDKSLAVAQAGGAGMVLVDNGAGLVAEVHSVPTVHVTAADGALIQAYAKTQNASAALSHFVNGISSAPAPVMADFSSRGPNTYDPNLLKPDLTAPGVDILAGVTPELTPAQQSELINGTLGTVPLAWALYQGTSMATPHVSGVAALLHQQHPSWTPAAIKSALMTSATDTYPDAETGLAQGILPWGQGAGHINPNGAADPGLVYDAGQADYQKYMCGAGMTAQCAGGTIVGYNLNMASITVNNVLGTTAVTRSVTNVGSAPGTYTASITLPGYTASVSPATLTLAPGETKTFTVSLTHTSSPENVWQYGKLTWSDGSHVVRSPVTARTGKPVVAPDGFSSDRAAASRLLSITTGFAGRMGASTGGLKEVSRSALMNVKAAPTGTVDTEAQDIVACNAGGDGVKVIPVTVPAHAVVAAFELFNTDTSSGNGGDDLDLMVLTSAGALVGDSLHGGANEAVVIPSPAAGGYKVCVIAYAPANGVSTDFNLSSDIVTSADLGGNLKVSLPSKVYSGGTATVGVSWSGLPAGKRYYGGVQYLDLNNNVAATTTMLVETNNPVPLAHTSEHMTRAAQGK